MKHFVLIFFLLLFTSAGLLTQRQVTGKVVDESGGPLPGVNILIKGTTSVTLLKR